MALCRKQLKLINKIVVFLVISVVIILIYSNLYGYIPLSRLLFYHILVLISIIIFLFSIGCLFLLSKINPQFSKYFFGAICGSFFTLLLLAYILSFVGKKIIGIPIRFQIFWVYLKHPADTIQALGLSPVLSYTFCIGIPILIIFFFIYWSKDLLNEIFYFQKKIIFFAKSKSAINMYFKFIILLISIFVGLTSVYYLETIGFVKRLNLAKEPLIQVYFGENILGLNFSKNIEPINVRKNYPKNIVFNKKNIILIIVDALRADYLNLYGYPKETSPFLSQLYNEGSLHKIDYTFSTSAHSFPGILSILRSKSWNKMGETNFSLPELFKDQGYRVNFVLSGDHTNFYNLRQYYGNNMDSYLDGADLDNFFPNDDLLLFEGLRNISAYQNTPNFFYFHLMSVHPLGIRHQESLKYLPASSNRLNIQSYQNNYNNGIIQMDSYLKKLFEQLTTKGYLKNSIVIITADHGESIGEDGIFGHANSVSSREIYIPLLIYDTDTSVNYIRKKYATQPDIAATIVDRLGLPIPITWEGKSLLKKAFSPFSFHCFNNSYAIINYQENKILKYCYNRETKKEAVFELKSDFYEKKNVLLKMDKLLLTEFRGKMKTFIEEIKEE
jgi:glucan phosphoethanolaminetransferase (alkaline phosphatase superfamily)